jgi:hypothetical protein
MVQTLNSNYNRKSLANNTQAERGHLGAQGVDSTDSISSLEGEQYTHFKLPAVTPTSLSIAPRLETANTQLVLSTSAFVSQIAAQHYVDEDERYIRHLMRKRLELELQSQAESDANKIDSTEISTSTLHAMKNFNIANQLLKSDFSSSNDDKKNFYSADQIIDTLA